MPNHHHPRVVAILTYSAECSHCSGRVHVCVLCCGFDVGVVPPSAPCASEQLLESGLPSLSLCIFLTLFLLVSAYHTPFSNNTIGFVCLFACHVPGGAGNRALFSSIVCLCCDCEGMLERRARAGQTLGYFRRPKHF